MAQLLIIWFNLENLDEKRLFIEAELETFKRKRDNLQIKIWNLQKDIHRMEKYLSKINNLIRDRLLMTENPNNLPVIYFITPTYYRPTQKADLTRLVQTLVHVPNLVWIVVEDAREKSQSVANIIQRSRIQSSHLFMLTPANKKLNETDPNWKLPRGVLQRNAALSWLRTNFGSLKQGVVYFGDDDNAYDLRLFEEMRQIKKVGVWPVGIVGGLLVETPIVDESNNSKKVSSFNSVWKPERPFPIDMAAFAVNLSLVNIHKSAMFSYDVPRGYQESHFLRSLDLQVSDLEPRANFCQSVYVWHTRTGKVKLTAKEREKFQNRSLSKLEKSSKHKTLNSYHGTHALRERAAKIKQGILIIRFEMPFNIWCLGCNNHIGMGVRYNAEKKKIGMYHTTPVYEFRMRCHLCENYFTIHTDPEVEHVEEDKGKGMSASNQIEKLEWIQERMRDDFTANQALRRNFRVEKKEMKDREIADDDLRKRTSLTINLLPETSEDKKLASLIRLHQPSKSYEEQREATRLAITNRSIFASSKKSSDQSTERISKKKNQIKIKDNNADAFSSPSSFQGPSSARKQLGIVIKSPSNPLTKSNFESQEVKTDISDHSTHADDIKNAKDQEEFASKKSLVDYSDSSD
ncbi:unnamed protein product [Dracunculus medinensis]|uniref:Galactosylgalactosylxylosylprotein 3-beta-glucuronosyltransferase n=1 Tax=Dracunculus medinensis TaxID=318479 RepID=A0A0N4U379_DRAME|nr:unnamed protein product [Dracunculus medinensis]